MAYHVEITDRAASNLRGILRAINATNSSLARRWFSGLEEAILGLSENPDRCPVTPENSKLRHLLYGKRVVYRIIYSIDASREVVTVIHIRHGAQDAMPDADK
jgi:plasmid stabilization system protein ParE